jgi:Gas vesicle synthesis protein GvpL/GvpF
MLYLYAFVPQPPQPTEARGVDGRVPKPVRLESIAAFVAHVDGALEPTDEHVLAHARVIDALAAANDAVLPVRFGRGFRDARDLEVAVAPRAPALARRLDEVRGCVELGLHVVAPAQQPVTAASGGDYLRRRLRDVLRAEELADRIHAPLAEHAYESTRTNGAGATALLRASYLVPRGDVDRFRACVEDLQRRHGELAFACTGPWPPYSFAA